ncbi:clasp N terminal-domain-containing protein [Chaetomidium leptoderma]|uniref:Clasp N terminal-domain-containing protein n=1 Tax=Chaetomidium leptoderma TaxID=669021 RepID=A0AAN6VRX4_9PEZI|nr:clasp N terminal-domain-containing protein [Chaetomidium leptoderma]
MTERITDDQVADLIAFLRTDAPVDAKVQQVSTIKSSIKQQNVPDTCILPVFEALRLASGSQHPHLVNAGFTALNHLFARLARQDPKILAKEGARTLPLIVDKLADPKEKFRQLAQQALVTLYKVAPLEVDRSVRNTAMVGKNPRAKEASLQWILQMHQDHGLQFRGYVPALIELLEDADGMVRDVAKSTVIELFRTAPNTAKSDLKKQLKTFKVRPAIEQAIVKELIPTSSAPASQTDDHEGPTRSAPPPRAALAASVSSMANRPVTPAPSDVPSEAVEPSYVNTSRELDEILRDMHSHFEGRETEQNWLKREEAMTKLRRLVAGNAPADFGDHFVTGLRALLDGIIKAVISLRTSLSKEGCSLVQDMARALGPAMDPMVELLMQTFIKVAAATKKISSSQANTTIDTIVSRVTYNARIMQHIWGACQDKNVQPRLYASGWLKTILHKEGHHKHHLEHTGGLDLTEKCIKKGLSDANPGVREKMRATYWTFAGIWPARAEALMSGLDATAARLLQNDPNNPNSPKKPEGGARPGLGLSKSTMGPPKPSVREAMLAQKRALTTTKALPSRPGSAMSHFSPVKTVSGPTQPSATTTTSAVRTRPEPAMLSSTGGLSGAPVRPGRRRPEMAARPATAGPYSVRSHDQPSNEQSSPPRHLKPKAVTPKSINSSPKRTVPKPVRPYQPGTPGESQLPSSARGGTPKGVASPRSTPQRHIQPIVVPPSSSPSKSLEDFTLVVPTMTVPRVRSPVIAPPLIVEPAAPGPPSPSSSLEVYEDPSTGEQQATPKPIFTGPVLEDRPVNEDAAILQQAAQQQQNGESNGVTPSPEKIKQNLRLLDSGISKVQQTSLDVHGFRKLQGIIRDSDTKSSTEGGTPLITDDKFDALLSGLFDFLESPLAHLSPEKAQDVKAQVLATIKLLLKRMRHSFQPHVSRGLESLLRARAAYDGRTHMVSGLELLAADLAALGDASEIVLVLSRMLLTAAAAMDDVVHDDAAAAPPPPLGTDRSLSMGLHVLGEMMDARGAAFSPSGPELDALASLAARCLESRESAVRMDAVLLCVALHARVGDARFWEAVKGVKEDPKSLITYYIVRRQREVGATAAAAVAGQAA